MGIITPSSLLLYQCEVFHNKKLRLKKPCPRPQLVVGKTSTQRSFRTGFEKLSLAGLCRHPDVDVVWHLLHSGLKVIVGKYWGPQGPRPGRNLA